MPVAKSTGSLQAILSTGPPLLWLTVFFFLPLGAVGVISFLSRGTYGELAAPWTFENYQRLAGFGLLGFDPVYPSIFLRSVLLAGATAILCLLAGLPLAFFIARLPGKWKVVALTLAVIPLWTNLLIRSYAWQILLGPAGWITVAAQQLGWISSEASLYPGAAAVLLCMVCDFLPFMVLPLYASVEKLDWTLAEAAMDLGATGPRVFFHAIVPQILPGVVAGSILVFLPAAGQFVVPDLLGGAKTAMLGNALQQQFGPGRDWPFGAAIAVASLLLVMLGLWLVSRHSQGKELEIL